MRARLGAVIALTAAGLAFAAADGQAKTQPIAEGPAVDEHSPPAFSEWKIERALETAFVVWGKPLARRCPNGIQFRMARMAEDFTAAQRLALNGESSAWVTPAVPCRITVNIATMRVLHDYEPFCTMVLHETGHIIGLRHTAHGIMSPNPVWSRTGGQVMGGRRTVSWAGTDRRCRHNGIPFLTRHHRL